MTALTEWPALEHGAHPASPTWQWARQPFDPGWLVRDGVPVDALHIELATESLMRAVGGPVQLVWWAELGPFLGIQWYSDGPRPAAPAVVWLPSEPVPPGTVTLALWASRPC
jgi:hypothetical protein